MDFELMINSLPKLLNATIITLKLLSASLFFGLFIFDQIILPSIVNKNNNIYLPDFRDLDYRIVQKKLDSLDLISQVIFHEYSKNYFPNLEIK